MATVVINKITYEVPELNFSALERAWPYLNEATTSFDPIKAVSAAINVIAAGLIEAPHFNPSDFGIDESKLSSTVDRDEQVFFLVAQFLKKATLAREIAGIREALMKIAQEAGLEAPSGEDLEDQPSLNLSMETVVAS